MGIKANIRKQLGEDVPYNRPGRKQILSDTIKRGIIRSVRSDEVDNAVQVTRRLQTFNQINVSAETVRRILREAGMRGRA